MNTSCNSAEALFDQLWNSAHQFAPSPEQVRAKNSPQLRQIREVLADAFALQRANGPAAPRTKTAYEQFDFKGAPMPMECDNATRLECWGDALNPTPYPEWKTNDVRDTIASTLLHHALQCHDAESEKQLKTMPETVRNDNSPHSHAAIERFGTQS